MTDKEDQREAREWDLDTYLKNAQLNDQQREDIWDFINDIRDLEREIREEEVKQELEDLEDDLSHAISERIRGFTL